MVRFPSINIPSIRVGCIDPTSDTSIAQSAGGEALRIEDIVDSTMGINNPEYSQAIIDANDKMLYGLRLDGYEYAPDLSNNTITVNEQMYNAQFIVDFVKDYIN